MHLYFVHCEIFYVNQWTITTHHAFVFYALRDILCKAASHVGSRRKPSKPDCQVRPELHRLQVFIHGTGSYYAPCASIIRIMCQTLEPSAFIMRSVFAAIVVYAVVAYYCVTDNSWELI